MHANTKKPSHVVTVVSACGTYTENLKCLDEAEANAYAQQLREDGCTATIALITPVARPKPKSA